MLLPIKIPFSSFFLFFIRLGLGSLQAVAVSSALARVFGTALSSLIMHRFVFVHISTRICIWHCSLIVAKVRIGIICSSSVYLIKDQYLYLALHGVSFLLNCSNLVNSCRRQNYNHKQGLGSGPFLFIHVFVHICLVFVIYDIIILNIARIANAVQCHS